MSDNTTIGVAATPGDIIATEDLGGYKAGRSKIITGAHGVDGGDVTPSNPFPIASSVGGSLVDPRAIRLLTSSDQVSIVGAGSAGLPAGGVVTVQGIASGTALPVSIAALPLPSGAAADATLTGGAQKSQQVGAGGQVTPAGDAQSRAIQVTPGDGTTAVAVKPASAAAITADPSLVVALSPNSPLPVGSNPLGSVGVTSQPKGSKHFSNLTATGTPSQVFPARPGRITAIIQNVGAGPVNLGGDNSVTSSSGLVLQGGQYIEDRDSNDAWWVVAQSGSVSLSLLEVY
jgi:hypothetical protein